MLDLQRLDFVKCFDLIIFEVPLPTTIEVLHVFLADLNVLSHLVPLNVLAQFILERNDLYLQKSHFLHKILVELILVHLTALFCK